MWYEVSLRVQIDITLLHPGQHTTGRFMQMAVLSLLQKGLAMVLWMPRSGSGKELA